MKDLSCPECGADGPFAATVKMYACANLRPDGTFEENLGDDSLEPLTGDLKALPSGGVARDVECGECGASLGDVAFDPRGPSLLAAPTGLGDAPADPLERMRRVAADDPADLVLDVDFGESVTIRDASHPEGSEEGEIAHWVAEEFDQEPGLFFGVLQHCLALGARVRYARSAAPRAPSQQGRIA